MSVCVGLVQTYTGVVQTGTGLLTTAMGSAWVWYKEEEAGVLEHGLREEH